MRILRGKRRPRERRQREHAARGCREARRRAIPRTEQEEGRAHEKEDEQRLALNLGRQDEQRRIDGGGEAPGERGPPAPEQPQRKGRDHDGGSTVKDRVRDLRGGRGCRVAQRYRGEKHGVTGRPEQVEIGAIRITPLVKQPRRGFDVGARIAELERAKSGGGDGQEARRQARREDQGDFAAGKLGFRERHGIR